MNEIAKHKAAIEDADTQNKVCNLCTVIISDAFTLFATSRVPQSTYDSSVTKHFILKPGPIFTFIGVEMISRYKKFWKCLFLLA